MLSLAIVAVVLLVLLYLLAPASSENFTNSVFESSLEKNMDYIKDNKGYTLNDYLLADSALSGKNITSPYL
jgi:hypothetical protein